ncbi:hypothetical protein KGF56_000504 [Candida oxycetoniae]|uniref:SP-RING-type domain-containing protein n=1 Tax=Candida oxycetoniae TaxID=497107 RepID=A0AAI9T0M0_9ASCO|nr:uncharacterized protein KGF56_000504 [Candida oxycetoniae]KAI3406658.2 hypothetical protein KGF56_000504 [Candida oxycetoniae]
MPRHKVLEVPNLCTENVSIVKELHPRRKVKRILVTIRLQPQCLKSIIGDTKEDKNLSSTITNKDFKKGGGSKSRSRRNSKRANVSNPEKHHSEKEDHAATLPKMLETELGHKKDLEDLEAFEKELLSHMTEEEPPKLSKSEENKVIQENVEQATPKNSSSKETTDVSENKVTGAENLPSTVYNRSSFEEKKKIPSLLSPSLSSSSQSQQRATNIVHSSENNTRHKQLPPNIIPLLEAELKVFEEDEENDDEDEAQVDKVIFSLKDPLGGTRITFPVKSQFCKHFECFDYYNFCLFNKLPASTQAVTKRNILKQNYEKLSRKTGIKKETAKNQGSVMQPQLKPLDLKSKSLQEINLPSYVTILNSPKSEYTSKFISPGFKNCPLYTCPICDTKFPLGALVVSDVFNYFVKMTSSQIERIELVGFEKYRPIGDIEPTFQGNGNNNGNEENLILISSDDDDDDDDDEGEVGEDEDEEEEGEENNNINDNDETISHDAREKMAMGNLLTYDNNSGWRPPFYGTAFRPWYRKPSEDEGTSWDNPLVLD